MAKRARVDLQELGSQGVVGVGAMQETQSDLMSENLDLFAPTQVEDTMLYHREAKYFPTGALTDEGPYTFEVPAESSLFLDTSSFRLEGRIKIVNITSGQEVNMGAGDICFPCNMWPHALFKTTEVSLNGIMISYVSTPAAHYRAMIETLLSYDENALKTHLRASGLNMDDPANMEDGKGESKGQAERLAQFKRSKIVDFCTPLHSDILRIEKVLPDRLSLTLALTRENDKFILMNDDATKQYKIKIVSLALHVRKIGLDRRYVEAVNRKLDAGSRAIFPMVRSIVKTRTIATGSIHAPIPDLFSGRIPNTVIVAMVESEAYNGTYSKNPFNFQHFGVNGINLLVNSKSYPAVRYQPDFRNSVFMREYRGLMDAIGQKMHNGGCLVTPERFKSGATLFAFDLTPDNCQNFHVHKSDRGNVQLELSFSAATSKSITVICYATLNDEFQLDMDRIAYSTSHIQP